MNTELLKKAGLNNTQAKSYLALITRGKLTPRQLAEELGESRTNAYMVLEQLDKKGLVRLSESDKVQTYLPSNPSALEKLVETRRNQAVETETEVKAHLPQLLNYFYTYQNQPGVRFFSGREGILKMYEDQLRVRKDIYFIRSEGDTNLLGDKIYQILEKRHKLGIKVYGIEEGSDKLMRYAKENDTRLGRDMAFFPVGSYTEPVNIYTYGEKTAIISFGTEVVGTIIESPQIAAAMRKMFVFIKLGAQAMMDGKQPHIQVE
jgi:sugar-specific transcriptional regulator TrmB